MNLLWGIGGVIGVLAIAFLLSSNRKAINWRTILIALALQMSFSFIVLRWDAGKAGLKHAADGVQGLINFSYEGIKFVAGDLVNAKGPWGFVFFIQALLPIVFISSLVAILYHFGIMQKFVSVVGGALSKLLGTSKAESLNSVTTVFLGQTEAPILIKPYLARLTNSEFFTIMVSGMTSCCRISSCRLCSNGYSVRALISSCNYGSSIKLINCKTNHARDRKSR